MDVSQSRALEHLLAECEGSGAGAQDLLRAYAQPGGSFRNAGLQESTFSLWDPGLG